MIGDDGRRDVPPQSETSPQGPPDEALIARLRSGDEAALSTLYRRHVQAIYRFVLGQVRDEDLAEDLTSDTFARMLRGLESFRGQASFKNWLYQIARNAVRNHRRSAAYRLNLPLAASLPAAETAEEIPQADGAAEEAQSRVADLLAPLPPRYRQVLELRFLSGFSLQETAERLAITVANAKVIQLRALQKLGRPTAAQADLPNPTGAPAGPAAAVAQRASQAQEAHRGPHHA